MMRALFPDFMYGTAWKEADTERCVHDALRAGFRAIDTANQRKHYHEAGVGDALRKAIDAGTLSRGDLFLQTKFTYLGGQDHRLPYDPEADLQTQVMQSFSSSLEHLHTDYLDSYVLHGPAMRHGVSDDDWIVWGAMEDLYRSGKVKALGVSNVALDQLESLCAECSVKPAFVQNRCFAATGWDREIRTFCSGEGVHYQGFSLLTANSAVLRQPDFATLVSRYECTPAQLIFAFALHVRMIPLTGTTKPLHMEEDLLARDKEIDPKDTALLESILD